MTKLMFAAADVRRVVNHAASATKWSKSYFAKRRKARPQMIFVHDEGLYLMSNGDPRDIVSGDRSFCAYAHGYDPNKEDRMEVWEKARLAVGGDDFAEYLDLSKTLIAEVASPSFAGLRIEVTGDSIAVYTVIRTVPR